MLLFGKKAKFADMCRRIVACAEDGVVIIDDSHRIVLFNDGAEKIFGYAAAEAMGEPLDILLPDRFHGQHGMMIEQVGAGATGVKGMGERSRQMYGRRKDGEEFIASIAVVALGPGRGFAAIVRDVSHNRKTEEELLRLAATDPLTGAFNRREFSAIVEREAQRASRYHNPLSVLMLDLDYFKRLNDNYGHAAGDKALQRFTMICCNTLRNVDIFGRWGGEEFVALLPETDLDGAKVIAERLRRLTAENVMTYNDHKINFTVSIGVAQFRDGETTLDTVLARADAAVYDAKKGGRDRVSSSRS